MVAETYEVAMARVYEDEGGYTNDPQDPGGPTRWGITIFDARAYAKEFGWITDRQVTAEDVRNMPKSFAAKVYKIKYADKIRYDDLPAGFDYSNLDAEINSGFGRSVPWAGMALGIAFKATVDNVVVYAKTAADIKSVIQKYWQIRLTFLHGLRTWSHFGPGWGRRCANGEAASVKMWLIYGAKLPAPEVKKKMDEESTIAKTESKKSAGKAAGSATGSAAPALPDLSHLSLGGKIFVGIAVTALVVMAIYFVRQAILHSQRATAYSAA